MKKISILVFSLLLCLSVLTACGGKDDFVPAGFQRISADEASYRLYVPDDWTAALSTGVTTAYVSDSDRSNVSFIVFELDDSIINVEVGGTEAASTDTAVTVDPESGEVPKITTVEEYWAYYESEFLKTFSDMTYSAKGENLLVSGEAAKKYVYTATVTGQSYEFMQVVTIKDGAVYILTYTATVDNFDKHLEDVNEIIGYLELK